MRFYNPLGFRIKGDNIILPVNKTEILHHDNPTKIDALVVHHNNSLGFKGPEPPRDFANWLTVVTVGGSTTECLEIAEDKTWPHVLGVDLQRDFNKLWLDNAGFCGQSTYGHYILMHDFIDKLQPKVAIFLIGINEVGVSGSPGVRHPHGHQDQFPLPGQVSGGHGLPQRSGLDGLEPVSLLFSPNRCRPSESGTWGNWT